ncbi:MAG: TetR/AcrR family transcriptional regulator [Polyangiaceae bacterium]
MTKRTTKPAAPRRGRPALSEADRLAVRARIAEAAEELFRADGYATVSICKIAKAVGYTPMAIYRYYESKLEILQTLWGGVFASVFEEVEAVEPQADPTERLVAISTAYVGYWLDHPDHYRLVFMAEGVTQPDVSLFVDDPELVARFGVFVEALAQASARELTGVEQKTKLDLLLCMLHGIAHNSVTISGYPWTAPGDLVREGVRGLVAVRG